MRICLLSAAALTLPKDLALALPFGEGEAQRLSAIKNPARLRESYAALLALKHLVGNGHRLIVRTQKGKPHFIGDHAPSFSMAHHGGLAVAACSDTPVGIDLELLRPYTAASAIAKRFFSQAEQERFAAYGGDSTAFFRVWTEKEALGKLLGDGFFYKDLDAPRPPFYQTYQINTDGRCYLLTLCTEQERSVTEWLMPQEEEFTYERLS